MKIFKNFVPLVLGMLALFAGCDKAENNDDGNYYSGRVITLTGVDRQRYNIVELTYVPKNDTLQVGNKVSFSTTDLGQAVYNGKNIDFQILACRRWIGPATADHLWPHYVAVVRSGRNGYPKIYSYTGVVIKAPETAPDKYRPYEGVVRIQTVETGDSLTANTEIAFDARDYGRKVEKGEIVCFRILSCSKAETSSPAYYAVIQPCKE